jgi:hypothetical protein
VIAVLKALMKRATFRRTGDECHVELGSSVPGRDDTRSGTVVDGWIASPGRWVSVVLGRLLGSTAARYARPDFARYLALEDNLVGFHLEVALPDDVGPRLVVSPGMVDDGCAFYVLAERSFVLADRQPLPYEEAFRSAEEQGSIFHRRTSTKAVLR